MPKTYRLTIPENNKLAVIITFNVFYSGFFVPKIDAFKTVTIFGTKTKSGYGK